MRGRPCLIVLVAAACAVSPARADRVAGARQARAWLGVGIDTGEVGVLITDVVDETPAYEAGLLPGDQILSVDRRRVGAPVELQRLIFARRVGGDVELRVLRDRRDFRVRLTLAAMPDANEILRRRLVDKRAPAFDLSVVSGGVKGRLADLRGKVVVIEFWASWCAACLSTHDALSRLASERGQDGLVVLAISRESRAVLAKFARKHKPAFAVLRDASGDASRAYYADQLPTLVVIDRRGVIRYAGISDAAAQPGLSAREAVEANVASAIFTAGRALRDKKRPSRRAR